MSRVSVYHIELFEEPKEAAAKQFVQRQLEVAQQRRQACLIAVPAMERLANVLKHRSGQPYKLRGLLYSLWNGKPFSLLELVGLDWAIRQDLLCVLAAFGYEDRQTKFFYRAVEGAIRQAGQWDWFLEERFNVEQLKEYLEAAERERKEDAP